MPSFVALVNLGTVGDDITSVKLYACTDSSCTSCVSLSRYTSVLVSTFPRNIGGIPMGSTNIKVESIGRCNVSQCISIIGIPTAVPTSTPTPTATNTPTPTPTPTATPLGPTSTPTNTPTPTPTSTPTPTPNCSFGVDTSKATPTPTPTSTSTPTPTLTPTSTSTPTPTPNCSFDVDISSGSGRCYSYQVATGVNQNNYGVRYTVPGQNSQDNKFNQMLAIDGGSYIIVNVCSTVEPTLLDYTQGFATGIGQVDGITRTGPNGSCNDILGCGQ